MVEEKQHNAEEQGEGYRLNEPLPGDRDDQSHHTHSEIKAQQPDYHSWLNF
jgi:hypothetical protein